MSRDLRQNTDQYVTIGPFIDQGDGKTLKNDLTVTNIKGIFSIQTQSAAATDSDEFTCDATAANDWGLASQGHGGLYQLKIPDSVINFVGSGFLSLYYATSYLPVWHEFRVLPPNVYDALKGTDLLDVNEVQVLGTACHAASENGTQCVEVVRWGGNDIAATAVNGVPKVALTHVNAAAQTATLDTVKADTAAIKVPTDKLVFTVANQVDSNVITKTGFALSATGLDLILHGATFMVALATAVWELATRTITALPAVTTDWLTGAGVKADAVTKIQAGLATPINITAATGVSLAASQHVIVDSGTVTTLTNAPSDPSGVTELLTRIPDATAGAAGGLPTVAAGGVKLVQTVDLTAGQQIDITETTVAEMAQGAPPASPTIKQMLNYLYRKLRNKQETTATVNSVFDDAGTTVLFKETHSDDATTFAKGKYGTGA